MHRRPSRPALVVLTLLVTCRLAGDPVEPPPASPAQPVVGFAADAVVGAGFTPGGEVLVFGTGRVPLRYATRVHHWNVVSLADGLGELTFPVPDGVPRQSIWAVVDLETGALQLAAAPGLDVEVERLPPGVLRSGSGGQLDRFAPGLVEGRILLVRPGGGAWAGHIADGADGDRDGRFDGAFEAALETLEPMGLAAPEPPAEVAPGDLLVILQPQALRILTLTVGPPL